MSDWLQQSALWCWQNSLAAGAMAAVVLGLRRVWRGRIAPGWLCAAGWLVMLRLLLPAPFSHTWAWDHLWMAENNVEPPVPPVIPAVQDAVILPVLPTEMPAVRAELESPPASFAPAPVVMPPLHFSAEPDATPAAVILSSQPAPTAVPSVAAPVDWPAIAAWTWAVGALFFLIVVISRHARFLRTLRGSADLDCGSGIIREAATLAGLRRTPALHIVPSGGSPFLCGVLRPRIVLPSESLARLSQSELRHVLLHEMLHIARRDLLANWLLIAARALHWWNPLIHLTARRLLADRELLRDQQAVALLRDPAERAAYGHTLLKLALPSPAPASSPGLAPFFRTEKELHRRLTMLQTPLRRPRLAATAAALTLAAIATPVFSTAQGQEGKKPEATATPVPDAAGSGRVSEGPLSPDRPPTVGEPEKQENLIQFSGIGQVSIETPAKSSNHIPEQTPNGPITIQSMALSAGGTPISPLSWHSAELSVMHSRLVVLNVLQGSKLVEVLHALGEGSPQFTKLYGERLDEEMERSSCLRSGLGPRHPKTLGLQGSIAVKSEQLEKLARTYVEMLDLQVKGAGVIVRDTGRGIETPQGIVHFSAPGMHQTQKVALEKAVRDIFNAPVHAPAAVTSPADELQQLRAEMAEMKAALAALRNETGGGKEAEAVPRAEAPKQSEKDGDELPRGTAEPNRPGMVRSPHAPAKGLVDVTDLASGTAVKCPYTGKLFRVP